MSRSPFPIEASPLEAELAKLYDRLAAINLAIRDLERYAELTVQCPEHRVFRAVLPLATHEAC